MLDRLLNSTERLPLWVLIPSVFIILVYSMLSFLAFTNPEFFYTSMTIPIPEHGFMLLSWGGKNTAMVMGILLATLGRRALPLVIMMGVFLTGQFGDINAGAQTNVNVFVTYIGMGFVILQLIILGLYASRTSVQKLVTA